MSFHVGKRRSVATVLGALAVLGVGLVLAFGVRSVVADPNSGPAGAPPNPGHSWSDIGDLPGTMWHSDNDGPGSGLDADTVDGLQASELGGGLTLPYDGTTSSTDPAFSITNSGTGIGVHGESSQGTGVDGRTYSDNEWVPAIYGRNEGNGDGVYGWSQNRHGTVGVTYSSDPEDAGVWASNDGPGPAIKARGNVLIESATTGAVVVELGEGLDYAEGFDVSDEAGIGPGTVLVIDAETTGKLAISKEAYDPKVVGVVSGANGLDSAVRVGGDQFDYNVALAGRVYCNVDASYGEVSPGDLLTTSPTPGYAMVVKDSSRAQGAILGKAMEGLGQGEKGQILILVTLQ